MLGLVDRLSHKLDFVIHRRFIDESSVCPRRQGRQGRPLSDAGEQKACSNERAKGRCKKDRRTLERWPGVGNSLRFRSGGL
jgi:hypothetical protein